MTTLIYMSVSAQKNVTKFLGIPVDGNKSEMKQKLLAKGFEYDSYYDYFTGEFNGSNVTVSIVTNNNKVWRIMVRDLIEIDETAIKIRFNDLCRQFDNNGKYSSFNGRDFYISDEEKISYNILVNKKRYEAVYYQMNKTRDDIREEATQKVLEKYTMDEIKNPPKSKEKEISDMMLSEAKKSALEAIDIKKVVWFMISEEYGKYRIIMYYDNEYNRADGEDL